MKAKWTLLIIVASTVLLLDQWTKLLAVKHLTPGFAQAHFAQRETPLPTEDRKAALEGLGALDQVRYFYGAVEEPCRRPGAYCRSVSVIDGFWAFRYVENPGAAWGLLASTDEKLRVPFFYVVSIAAIAFILGFFRKLTAEQRLVAWGLSLVFGGALGNFIDRLHLSYVIDFIDWYVGRHHWPTFNVADSAISVGVGLMLLDWAREAIQAKSSSPEGTKKPSQEAA